MNTIDYEPGVLATGPTLDHAMTANPVLGSLDADFRAAFRAAFDHPVRVGSDGVLIGPDGGAGGVAPGEPALYLIGEYMIVEGVWTTWPYRARGRMYFGDVVFTDMPGFTATRTSDAGLAWVARATDLAALRAGPYGSRVDDVIAAMARGFRLAASPILDSTLNADRMVFGAKMAPRTAKAGEEIIGWHHRRDALYVVGARGKVRVERKDAKGVVREPFWLGFGGLVVTTDAGRNAPFTYRVVAEEDTELLWLAADPLRDLLKRGSVADALERLLNTRAYVAFHADEVVAALTADPLFCCIDPSLLHTALQGALAVPWPGGLPAPTPIGDLAGISVVVDGEVSSYRLISPGDSAALTNFGPIFETLATYGAGRVFGQRTLVTESSMARHWQARVASHVVFVPRLRLLDTLGNDPTWQANFGAIGQLLARHEEMARLRTQDSAVRPALILAARYDGDTWSTGLSALVAGALDAAWEAFHERSVLVELVATRGGGSAVQQRLDQGPVGWMRVSVSARPRDIAAVIADLVAQLTPRGVSNIVIAPGPGLPGAEVLAPLVDRVAFFNTTGVHDPSRSLPLGAHLVYAWFLAPAEDAAGPKPDRNAPPAPPFPPATVRLRVDLPAVEAWADAVDWMSPEVRAAGWPALGVAHAAEQLARLARTLTHRRVGLALSGGESWGFAHYALIGALEYARIPVDMISGASAGAVIGAFYSTGGIQGLRHLLTLRGRLQAISAVSSFTSVPLEAYFNRQLDGALLERLDLPLVPVATNLQMSSPEPILTGPVAHACRLSGSFVPVYPPSPERRATYVDGAFSANLPADVLQTEGMRFVVASNAMSPTADQAPHPPMLPGVIGEILADLNPVRRLVSLYEGVLSLAYASGSASARNATRTFQATRTDLSLFNMVDTPEIIHRALCQPTLWQTMAGVVEHWELLCQPRVKPPPT